MTGFAPHPDRDMVLGEVHARPFHPVSTPARMLRFAFMTDAAHAAADRAALWTFCEVNGAPGPAKGVKQHRVVIDGLGLRWEQHSEFTTYTWELSNPNTAPFDVGARSIAATMGRLPQPGPHLSSIDLHLLPSQSVEDFAGLFQASSLAASGVDGGGGLAATDFLPDQDGFVRLLVLDRSLTPTRAGALTQRLMEIETYRTLALLGLPEVIRSAPNAKMMEDQLVQISSTMIDGKGLADDRQLLDQLTALAATLEAEATSAGYRFGATRAYDNLVQQRLISIEEVPVEGAPTWAAFLARRVNPAMRTCAMLEDRQANLSRKLARATALLRARVDVEIERQNSELLASMDARARAQLRLQQTVEGLSVAAISYYVVGLIGYMVRGAREMGYFPIDAGPAMAVSAPVVIALVWRVLYKVRRKHMAFDRGA
jgi:uncharacterized membrane-anchored protein